MSGVLPKGVDCWRWFSVGQRVTYTNKAWERRGYIGPLKTGDTGTILAILGGPGSPRNIVVKFDMKGRRVVPWAHLRIELRNPAVNVQTERSAPTA